MFPASVCRLVRRCLEHFQHEWNRDACLKLRHAMSHNKLELVQAETLIPHERTKIGACWCCVLPGFVFRPAVKWRLPPTRRVALRLVRSYHRAPAVIVVNLGGDVAVAIPVPVDSGLEGQAWRDTAGLGGPADAKARHRDGPVWQTQQS